MPNPKPVISNTSPLVYLHRLEQLQILETLFGEILVPNAVIQELERGQELGKDVPNVLNYLWVKQISVTIPEILQELIELGAGELEVLALALEHPHSLVILDDQLARQTAMMSDIKLIGTVGILLLAKTKNLISEIAPLLEQLPRVGFRLHEQTKLDALRLAGE